MQLSAMLPARPWLVPSSFLEAPPYAPPTGTRGSWNFAFMKLPITLQSPRELCPLLPKSSTPAPVPLCNSSEKRGEGFPQHTELSQRRSALCCSEPGTAWPQDQLSHTGWQPAPNLFGVSRVLTLAVLSLD